MIISIYYVISTDSTKNDVQRILIISYNVYGSSYFLIKDLTINFADNPGNESIVFAAPSQVEQIWYLKIFFSKCKRKIAYYLVNCGSHLVNHFTSDEDEEPFCFRLNINQNLPIVINVDFIVNDNGISFDLHTLENSLPLKTFWWKKPTNSYTKSTFDLHMIKRN